jgi:hypothetical protein
MLRGFDDERRIYEVQQPLTPPHPLKEVAQSLGHRQYPLAHGQAREDMIDQTRPVTLLQTTGRQTKNASIVAGLLFG